MAPVHRGAQRLLVQGGGAAPGGEQPEAVPQAGGDLLHGEDAGPRRRQLQGQGQPVQAGADLGHGGGVRRREGEPGAHGGDAVKEEAHGGDLGQALGRQIGPGVGRGEGGHAPHRLALHSEGLPAGGQDAHAGRGAQDGVHHPGHGPHQVLAVVQQQQQAPVAQGGDDRLQARPAGHLGDARAVASGGGDELGVGHRGQLHEGRPVREERPGAGAPSGEPARGRPAGRRRAPRGASCRPRRGR